ncbi:GntR family transcriptional regulator [Streptomyces synnematoformans]|uniref:GntR family transcriptional regulator n=1 Tax=Streptomyces synnematoformans TaxID=415721 RepID=UPI0031DA9802
MGDLRTDCRCAGERIRSEALAPGEALPSESTLAAEFGVVRNTPRGRSRSLRTVGPSWLSPGGGGLCGLPASRKPGRQRVGRRRMSGSLRRCGPSSSGRN